MFVQGDIREKYMVFIHEEKITWSSKELVEILSSRTDELKHSQSLSSKELKPQTRDVDEMKRF